MISKATRLLDFAFKKEGNCNVMKSHNQLCDECNLIGIISYHNSSQGQISHPLPNLSNLSNQPFKSIF